MRRILVLLTMFAVLLVLSPRETRGQSSTPTPDKVGTLSTDKLDYQPGESVVFSGTYWEPGERVRIVVDEAPQTHSPVELFTYADTAGNIVNSDLLVQEHDRGVFFTAVATGETSGFVARVTFTDGLTTSSSGIAGDYTIAQGTGTIVPGTALVGDSNTRDDTVYTVQVPFELKLYGKSYAQTAADGSKFTNLSVSTNGVVQFESNSARDDNQPMNDNGPLRAAIAVYWDDLVPRTAGTHGIFTSITIENSKKVLNIEWRTTYGPRNTASGNVNFQLRLFEGEDRFEIIYGTMQGRTLTNPAGTQTPGQSASVGVVKKFDSNWTQWSYNESNSVSTGLKLTFTAPASAKKSQTITFDVIGDQQWGATPPALTATASSGLPVSYEATGACSVSQGVLSFTAIGSCSVTAKQAGNSEYDAATPVTRSFNIGKADQTITFDAIADQTFGGADLTLSATATSGLTVSFTASGACELSSATTLKLTGGGSCTVTANQAGDTQYNAAPAVQRSFSIGKASQTITFDPIPNKTFGDPDFTISASASSGLAVTFTVKPGSQCTLTGVTVHLTGAGNCEITASQEGNANYGAAASVTQVVPIAKAGQTITFAALGDKTFGDAAFTIAATASSGLDVSFAATGKCTVAGTTVTITGAGKCTVTASQAGNDDYEAAEPVAREFTIAKADQTITFGALADKTYGDAPFTVSATASSGLPVSFAATGKCSVNGTSVTITGAGSCTVTAKQEGNENYNPAPDVPQQFTIAKADQTITFGALADKTYGDAPFTISASASSNLDVTFAATGKCTVSGNTVTIVGAGTCDITASQPGDDNYNPATAVKQTLTIQKANQAITFGPLATKTYGDPAFSVAASATSNLPVAFSATGTCSVSGTTVSITGAGSCVITASQPGDDNYNPAQPVAQSFTINKATPTISVTGGTFTYDELPHAATVSVSGVGGESVSGTWNVTYNGATGVPTFGGVYSVLAEFTSTNPNYTNNSGTATITITFSGTCSAGPGRQVLQPINSDGSSLFQRKQGSTVPVKFRVCSAAQASVGPTPVVKAFRIVSAVKGTAAMATPEEIVSTTPDKTFRWDPTAQQWIFNMATSNLSSGVTYQFSIDLVDGTAIPFVIGVR